MNNLGAIFDHSFLTKSFVRELLNNPIAEGREWTWQGLGMLRMYLTSRYRLHIWCPSRATKNVSTMHTHPWDFTSYVVCGVVQNKIYDITTSEDPPAISVKSQKVKCGAGGCKVGAPAPMFVALSSLQVIKEGQYYSEKAEQIHESVPVEGTVTIVDRQPREDADHAYVFYPYDREWVSAEPRPATDEEVKSVCKFALYTWFHDPPLQLQ